MKKKILFLVCLAGLIVGLYYGLGLIGKNDAMNEPTLQKKVESYATVELSSPLYDNLSENDKQILELFRKAAQVADRLFWKQTFGDKDSFLSSLKTDAQKAYAQINYGPWDRLDGNKPFIEGYAAKPLGCRYYPEDITREEFDAFQDPDKNSLYTVLRRDENGKLKCVWYRDEYKEDIVEMCSYLEQAAALAQHPGLKNYLLERIKAFRTDDYLASDLAWMDMKGTNMDFVIGPIENYDDKFNEAKASYESFILLKDESRSSDLAKYISFLPELQTMLPCAPEYKTFVPGTSSDLNVYDVIYYAGDSNAGSKTIAINLPNDERVHALRGTRRLQLYNTMMAKFDAMVRPIGELLIVPDQQKYLSADAFFWNVTFHEVAHGLGVKTTVNGKGSVDEAMGTERTTWEEAKADILGLFMVCTLIDKGEVTNITKEEAITTFIGGFVRSIRFGSASSHAKGNMMCYNWFRNHGAFTRNEVGQYMIDFDKALEAINSWADKILTTQATGDFEGAKAFAAQNATVNKTLADDIARVNAAGIPRDICFRYGW